jgi:hypothetical protein
MYLVAISAEEKNNRWYCKTVNTKIRVLRQQISSLERTLKSFRPMLAPLAAASLAPKAEGTRRAMTLSPKARASLRLQGRYMGYMRQLKPRQKA